MSNLMQTRQNVKRKSRKTVARIITEPFYWVLVNNKGESVRISRNQAGFKHLIEKMERWEA